MTFSLIFVCFVPALGPLYGLEDDPSLQSTIKQRLSAHINLEKERFCNEYFDEIDDNSRENAATLLNSLHD